MPAHPFHAGEREVQRRVGEVATAELNGRIISPRIPSAARSFVGRQDLVVLGTEDADSALWATLITGAPGFTRAADDLASVRIEMKDPLGTLPGAPSLTALRDDQPVALLFIDLATRRRLRVNGAIAAVTAGELEVRVAQAYPACPKYIQRREVTQGDGVAGGLPAVAGAGDGFPLSLRERLAGADTLFIATAGADGLLDVSHRGGRRGFAELEGDTIRIPDFVGNSMFNTLGNLVLDGRAGLCVPDFDSSAQWLLTGRAVVRFDVAAAADRTGGTRRWIEFTPERWVSRPLNVSRTWTFVESSPYNP